MSASPTIEGFRAAFRRPSFALAEVTWRWAVGATAAILFFFGLLEYLDTQPVSNGELLFVRTRQPYLVWEAIAHILRAGMNRGVIALLVAVLAIVLLWILVASLGRMVMVPAVIEYFRRRVASDGSGHPFRALVRLNFLRAVVVVAALVGFVGAGILASFVSPAADPQPGLAILVFIPLAALICLICWLLNWLLSLAAMFAVRDREDAVGAISMAVSFCRERFGAVLSVSIWTGLAHLVIFFGATTIASTMIGVAGLLPWRVVLLAVILVTLIYFAVADWLYVARLSGYVFIAEMPESERIALPPHPSFPVTRPPVQTTIDRDEPILSDVPGLIPGM
jgi:hypothetical protein